MAGLVRQPIDVARLGAYIEQNVHQISLPISLKQFGHGQSNPTYEVTSATDAKFVLRKKPPGKLLSKTAHAIEREYEIIKALETTDGPVPKLYCLCEDSSVIGTPFYIMSFLDGRIFEDPWLPSLKSNERSAIWKEAVHTLAKLHSVDLVKIGLRSWKRPTDFYTRQIKAFSKTSKAQASITSQSGAQSVGHMPYYDELVSFFADSKTHPPDVRKLVHGDFKLDNLVFHKTEPRVIGILDWEMATEGHPLADLANLLMPFSWEPQQVPFLTSETLTPELRVLQSNFQPGKVAGIPRMEQCQKWYRDGVDWDTTGYLDWGVAFNTANTTLSTPNLSTMKSVVFKGVKQVALEDRPKPTIQDSTDIIVKVNELHVFRGHQPSGTNFIMGHEFTGVIDEIGSAVTSLKTGDAIVSPFTVSCGECFFCKRGFSSRCDKSLLFGTTLLDGAQAEYVRIPYAESTVLKAPKEVEDIKLCLMADIFPTGCFAASNGLDQLDKDHAQDSIVVLIGCGPVGICALIAALEYRPKAILAVDGIESRLALAKSLGAEPWNYLTQKGDMEKRVKELSDGRGADVVIEVVGHSSALDMGFKLLRPWGIISSVGVHNGEIPWTGNQAYGKNLCIKMGRCPVRSIFEESLKLLAKKQHLLDFMTATVMPLSDALEGYELFDSMKVQKVIFDAER
ncbi:hypothetical protein FSARC_2861 [Fusarium sarcochroum]|uniref:Enoyl reductase (ER) domain-containing protein n=1 Tax=Fusarium sarcochroum TaxID=1208366 RepID=A0A8H4U5S2_9HYPO|nr:hypothetical protein FSARC_2861 [Fusarium sarcochroum]